MSFVKYCPTVPEEPPPESRMKQWSMGIAMFAAFVIPFILLLTSARYRVFVAQAKHQIEVVSHGPLNSLYGGTPHTEKQP